MDGYMICLGFFQSVEFYVIAAVIAAAVIAAASLPGRRGPVRTFLYAGRLLAPRTADTPPSGPGIVVRVDEHARLVVHRFGLEGVHESGAYSLAVKISGFDVVIEERLTSGHRYDPEMTQAEATADCLGRERYHFQYNSESTARKCSFTLNIAPDNTITRALEL